MADPEATQWPAAGPPLPGQNSPSAERWLCDSPQIEQLGVQIAARFLPWDVSADAREQEARSWFLAAGYAVVAVDVRGTGASFGSWRAPWQPEERADSQEIVDWIVSQPWSNQQVGNALQAGRH